MKKSIVAMCLAGTLAACNGGNPNATRSAEWQALKSSCVGGNFDACADIGHMERDAQRVAAGEPRVFKVSEPIID